MMLGNANTNIPKLCQKMQISGRKTKRKSSKQMVASIAETLTSNTHLEILGFAASPRQYLNKSESSNYTANGDLTIKSLFVNVVSSTILSSQAGYHFTLVPRSPFPVPRSPFPVPRSPFPVPRSPFPVPRSPFPAPRSPLPAPRSPLSAPRSPLPAPRSPLPAPRSPLPISCYQF